MWVTNAGGVTKLSPSGETIGTYSVGTNMWVSDGCTNNVTKLSPSGATLGTYSVGTEPLFGMAFDGLHMWVVNVSPGTVYEL
jgi:hypothetical protein